MTFGADFDDIFEVRGIHRQKKGQRLEDQVEKDLVLLSYEGLDNTIRQTRIQCDPGPKTISASELQFEVHLQPRRKAIFHLAISCDSRAVNDSIGYCSAIVSARGEQKTAGVPRIYSSILVWLDQTFGADVRDDDWQPWINYPCAGVPWFGGLWSGRDHCRSPNALAQPGLPKVFYSTWRGRRQEISI
jgi:glycogen debranching enzyme